MTCCLCNAPGEVCTPFIDGAAFSLCRKHFNMFVHTTEDIGMWAWCKRATAAWIIVREDDTLVCEPCYADGIYEGPIACSSGEEDLALVSERKAFDSGGHAGVDFR